MANVHSNLPRIDATADLYVSVTEEDIKKGKPKDHCHCAVAQAVRRATGLEETSVVILPTVAYVLMPTDRRTAQAERNRNRGARTGELAWHRFRIGNTLSKQILAFDLSGEASPGQYRFDAPTPSTTMSAKQAALRKHELLRDKDQPRSPRKPIAAPWRRDVGKDLREYEPA